MMLKLKSVVFFKNGVVLGQIWDGPSIALKNEGEVVNYMAPQECALAWRDGLSIPKRAKILIKFTPS